MDYTPTLDIIKKFNCDYYAHGDDPCLNSEGIEVTDAFKEVDRFKLFKRTEGVSTTDITGKLLAIAKRRLKPDEESPLFNLNAEPPK